MVWGTFHAPDAFGWRGFKFVIGLFKAGFLTEIGEDTLDAEPRIKLGLDTFQLRLAGAIDNGRLGRSWSRQQGLQKCSAI